MNTHALLNLVQILANVAGVVWVSIAYVHRKKPRWQQEGLSKWQKVGLLFLPLWISIICLALSKLFNLTPQLWIGSLFLIVALAMPFCHVTAEWIGVPLKIRQAANLLMLGVALGLAVMVVPAMIAEAVGI